MPDMITLLVNGNPVSVSNGAMVSAAIMIAGETSFRTSVSEEPRGPLCGMGICFECRVTINGESHLRSCQILSQPGMEVRTCV